jgi:alcohol dehydrogenase class IV
LNSSAELRKFVAPEIITGIDARLMAGRYLSHFTAQKPIIVTDSNIVKQKWFKEIITEIEKHVGDYLIFKDISPNPRDSEVMAGTELFLTHKCDLILAIGGGSPIDCAKGISIVSSNGGHI